MYGPSLTFPIITVSMHSPVLLNAYAKLSYQPIVFPWPLLQLEIWTSEPWKLRPDTILSELIPHLSHTPTLCITQEQFSKGPLLNCRRNVKFYKICLGCETTTIFFYTVKVLLKIFSNNCNIFTTMLKLSKGPQLPSCRVNSTYAMLTETGGDGSMVNVTGCL